MGDNIPGTVGIFGRILLPRNGAGYTVHLSSNSVSCLSGGTEGVLSSTNLARYAVATSGTLSRCLVHSLVVRNTRISAFNINRELVASSDSPMFNNICGLITIRGSNNRVIPGVGIDRGAAGVAGPRFGGICHCFSGSDNGTVTSRLYVCSRIISSSGPEAVFSPGTI